MTKQTFLWHDYETFGAVPRRDRPAQFAAIRTDAELNEIGDALMIYCKPAPDYLPSPQACLITGITPQLCLERGLPEHEFAAQIETAFSQPGTIGVGYNTIRFDDEVTRFLFWRNLIDPTRASGRTTAVAGTCSMSCGCAMRFAPRHRVAQEGRRVAELQAGRLARANGLLHEAAHDALSDVRATIALARLIRTRQPSSSTSRWDCARRTVSLLSLGCRPCGRRRGPSCTSRACSRPNEAAWP